MGKNGSPEHQFIDIAIMEAGRKNISMGKIALVKTKKMPIRTTNWQKTGPSCGGGEITSSNICRVQ